MLPVGVFLCIPVQYGVLSPLAAIIAAGRRGRLVTGHCRRSTGISSLLIQQGLAELTKILGRVVHTGDWKAQFISNMFQGAAVYRSCRLLDFSDFALLKEIKDYPGTVSSGVIFLVAVVIPKMLP